MDSISGSVRSALPSLNNALARYRVEGVKTNSEVLNKKGRDLSFRLYRGFRKLSPRKGKIREDAQARFDADEGTQVRSSILEKLGNRKRFRRGGKVINRQAEAVRRELNLRSRGAGFLSVGFLFRNWKKKQEPRTQKLTFFDRARNFISKTEHNFSKKESSVRILNVAPALEGIGRQKGIVTSALDEVRRDTERFLNQRQGGQLGRILKRNYRPA